MAVSTLLLLLGGLGLLVLGWRALRSIPLLGISLESVRLNSTKSCLRLRSRSVRCVRGKLSYASVERDLHVVTLEAVLQVMRDLKDTKKPEFHDKLN